MVARAAEVHAIEWRVRRFCHWDHIAQEASVDGTALVMGFLILQLILYFHTGSLHPIEGLVVKPEDESLVSRMWVWSLGFGVLVAVVTGVEPHMMSPLLQLSVNGAARLYSDEA